jgi:hypothetical protein
MLKGVISNKVKALKKELPNIIEKMGPMGGSGKRSALEA